MTTAQAEMPEPPTYAQPEWTFADRLRKARLHARLDQRTLAHHMKVGASALAGWEAGRFRPKNMIRTALAVQRVTGVEAAWLLDGELDEETGVPLVTLLSMMITPTQSCHVARTDVDLAPLRRSARGHSTARATRGTVRHRAGTPRSAPELCRIGRDEAFAHRPAA